MSSDGVKAICEVLKTNTSLTSLNLRCKGKRNGKKEKEKKSDDWLTDNGVGAEGAKALSEMLKVNTTLTSLNIRSERGKGWKEKEKK